MKYNPAVISFFFQQESTKRNVRQLLKFLLVLSAMVAVYSILFHFIMAAEGQHHDILGRSLAAWTVGGDCKANIISRFDEPLRVLLDDHVGAPPFLEPLGNGVPDPPTTTPRTST